MQFARPHIRPEHAVSATFARYYLDVSYGTLRRLRECNAIPAFAFPSPKGRTLWRYPIRGLHEFFKRHQKFGHAWNPSHNPEMPGHIAAYLLGVNAETAYTLRYRGILRNYTPIEIRRYLRRQTLREVKSELKAQNRVLKCKVKLLECLCKP